MVTPPINLIAARHGESEGNVANRATKASDDRLSTMLSTGVASGAATLVRKLDHLAGTARDFGDADDAKLRGELALAALGPTLRRHHQER